MQTPVYDDVRFSLKADLACACKIVTLRPNGAAAVTRVTQRPQANPGTGKFGVVSSGGSIRTYYKPDPAVHGKGSNLDYFNAQ